MGDRDTAGIDPTWDGGVERLAPAGWHKRLIQMHQPLGAPGRIEFDQASARDCAGRACPDGHNRLCAAILFLGVRQAGPPEPAIGDGQHNRYVAAGFIGKGDLSLSRASALTRFHHSWGLAEQSA